MNPLLSIKGTIISGFVLAIVFIMILADGSIPIEAEGYIRWLHYLSGVTWIGLLYYFNFVQVPAMAKATAGTEAFTGTVETSDKDVAIANNSSGSGTQWNLVSNPYPSYLALNSAAESASSATSNFITQNAITTDVLGSGTNEDALWYWKGFEYGQYNNSHTAKYIAPGQGFFVASKTGGGNLKFLESMQTTTGGDDFIAGDIMEDNRGELFIRLNQNDLLRETEIYFIENN